jgi:hypothetical protein
LKSLKRAQNNRRRRRERMLRRSQFTRYPFQFVRKMLGDEKSGRLECPSEEFKEYLRNVHTAQ